MSGKVLGVSYILLFEVRVCHFQKTQNLVLVDNLCLGKVLLARVF